MPKLKNFVRGAGRVVQSSGVCSGGVAKVLRFAEHHSLLGDANARSALFKKMSELDRVLAVRRSLPAIVVLVGELLANLIDNAIRYNRPGGMVLKAACPSFVSEYGALNSWLVFSTKCFRLRYCMSAFIDSRCILNIFVTSLIRSAPVSRIAESTLRTRSDSTGGRGASA